MSTGSHSRPGSAGKTRQILSLAWPVLVGQLAVMGNAVIDTVMAARSSPADLAAIGLGASVYITVYVTTMGVVLALSPIIAQQFGARREQEIGASFAQGLWLALLLSIVGCIALASTDLWLAIGSPPEEVAQRTRLYLYAVAAGLPGALLFRAYYALNTAISRPRAVMAINLIGLAMKAPLNALFIHGASFGPDSTWSLPALGGPGCGVATAVISWASAGLALLWLRLAPSYRRFQLFAHLAPSWTRLRELIRLGLPIGASYLVEVTSFTFMALFVARLGTTVGASHQITANLAGIVYMMPLALSNATSVLVAQSVGAAREQAAREMALRGFRLMAIAAFALSFVLWSQRAWIAGLYSPDPAVIEAAIPLIGLLALFHLFDATQTLLVSVLRAYKIVLWPTVVYVVALWGVGLGGGWWLTFETDPRGALGRLNGQAAGAASFWLAGFVSLAFASAGLFAILRQTWKERLAAGIMDQPGASQPADAEQPGAAARKV